MVRGSSTLSEFRTSLSKVLTLWHCVKVKQRYPGSFWAISFPTYFKSWFLYHCTFFIFTCTTFFAISNLLWLLLKSSRKSTSNMLNVQWPGNRASKSLADWQQLKRFQWFQMFHSSSCHLLSKEEFSRDWLQYSNSVIYYVLQHIDPNSIQFKQCEVVVADWSAFIGSPDKT